MLKEIDYINAKINKKDVQEPQFLYKYRTFDAFTFDMFANEYVYLCPAEKLDDPSECKVDFSVQDFYDLKTNRLTFKSLDMILEMIKPYTNAYNFGQLKNLVYSTLTPSGNVKRNFLLDVSFDMQKLVPNIDIIPLINWIGNIPERLNEPQIRQNFEMLFSLAHNARRDMGICSLSELSNSKEMWKNYADDSKGYCIEYNMRDYDNLYVLYPVIYQENRETNIVTNILSSFIGEMIFGISNGQIKADKSQFFRLFLTKDLKWSYQKEWRLLGDAKQKLRAPSIHAIYLGKNMSQQDKIEITTYCKKRNIKVEWDKTTDFNE